MDIRYSANQNDFKRYTTEEVRKEFLIKELFTENKVNSFYSHVDRVVVLGCMPATEEVPIDKGIDIWKNFGTDYLLERREIGIFNIGGTGIIQADTDTFKLQHKDCLYISMETKKVFFKSENSSNPAKFYMVSAPAHKPCKTTFLSINDAKKIPCGAAESANKRTINLFIPMFWKHASFLWV